MYVAWTRAARHVGRKPDSELTEKSNDWILTRYFRASGTVPLKPNLTPCWSKEPASINVAILVRVESCGGIAPESFVPESSKSVI